MPGGESMDGTSRNDEETTYVWEIDENNIDNYEEFYTEIRKDSAIIDINDNDQFPLSKNQKERKKK